MSSSSTPSIIALMHGEDQRGLVAKVSGWIYDEGGNIVHADQHRDSEQGIFSQRVEWTHPNSDLQSVAENFSKFASTYLNMKVHAALGNYRPRVAIMVSRMSHAFHELILDWKQGDLPCEIVCVISNHEKLREESKSYCLPYYHVPLVKSNKLEAEKTQLEILRKHEVELTVMARYMQILSDEFLTGVEHPVINIHHSFLPAFAGAKPYHQAHQRGVKLIGATAHYATKDLDEGPIIHQDVARVSHRHSVSDLLRIGRDMEKVVLSEAVRLHLENRILVFRNKTVVFD